MPRRNSRSGMPMFFLINDVLHDDLRYDRGHPHDRDDRHHDHDDLHGGHGRHHPHNNMCGLRTQRLRKERESMLQSSNII